MKTTFIATGDAFMTRRLPEGGYPGFRELQEVIAAHDVRFNNLEFTVHDREGFPAAFSGGTWAMAEPEILDDLQKFGFNLYNTANNHSGDYSHGGILATIRHLRERGLRYAGTGENLAGAAGAAYLDTPNARVALIAASSSFHESHAAGSQGPELVGRPGLNPLRFEKVFHVEKEYYETLEKIAEETDMNAAANNAIRNGYRNPLPEGRLSFGGLNFVLAEETAQHTRPLKKDMDRIMANIREARRQADYVLVSIHSHEFAGRQITEPAEFLVTFAHACIEAGADAVLGHGPHELRGIEIYQGKPIFYSLGNFIFQTETVSVQPADAYENKGMSYDTKVGEYMDRRSKNGTQGYGVQENIWRSVMAGFTAEDGEITEIRLYPVTLNMTLSRGRKGFPCLMEDNAVLQYLADLSAPFGTRIEVGEKEAVIRLK